VVLLVLTAATTDHCCRYCRDVEGLEGPNGSTIQELGPFKIKTCTKSVTVTVEKNGVKVSHLCHTSRY
jgi:hypothetical protein